MTQARLEDAETATGLPATNDYNDSIHIDNTHHNLINTY